MLHACLHDVKIISMKKILAGVVATFVDGIIVTFLSLPLWLIFSFWQMWLAISSNIDSQVLSLLNRLLSYPPAIVCIIYLLIIGLWLKNRTAGLIIYDSIVENRRYVTLSKVKRPYRTRFYLLETLIICLPFIGCGMESGLFLQMKVITLKKALTMKENDQPISAR